MAGCSSNIHVPRSMTIPQMAPSLLHNLPGSISHLSLKPVSRRNRPCISIIAMANNEGRDNLDHLKKASNLQTQQQQPRRIQSAPAAPIGLWDRFPTARTMQQMLDTMDRLWEDPLAYNGGVGSQLLETGGGFSRGRTPWEIKEAEGVYKMRFDMPGMTKEDVKVWVEDNMLVVKAEKLAKEKGNGDEQGEEEWSAKSYGKYSCRIALPEKVQFEKIKAEVKDGVLNIAVPKAPHTSNVLDISVE